MPPAGLEKGASRRRRRGERLGGGAASELGAPASLARGRGGSRIKLIIRVETDSPSGPCASTTPPAPILTPMALRRPGGRRVLRLPTRLRVARANARRAAAMARPRAGGPGFPP